MARGALRVAHGPLVRRPEGAGGLLDGGDVRQATVQICGAAVVAGFDPRDVAAGTVGIVGFDVGTPCGIARCQGCGVGRRGRGVALAQDLARGPAGSAAGAPRRAGAAVGTGDGAAIGVGTADKAGAAVGVVAGGSRRRSSAHLMDCRQSA